MSSQTTVMVAGIGGASLGSEILKALALARRYRVFGCDISRTAYGLYEEGFTKTYFVDRQDYVPSVIAACHDAGARLLIPGGEAPMVLLGAQARALSDAGLQLVCNNPDVIATCSNKAENFRVLNSLGIAIPHTSIIDGEASIESVGIPCVVKPATGTGGSAMVFFATDVSEALIYADYIRRMGGTPIAQEYISEDGGEYTVGVLSLPDGSVAGSIALRRALDAKLSVMMRCRGGVISSGYSQGYIDDFPEIRHQCELIARALGSTGPLNIQGRLRGSLFVPFEINPRFSASTHLRALAGFNELDIYLQALLTGEAPGLPKIRKGWYLRSLTEKFVAPEAIRT
jgi:carbamoyl-phosphate synthase large subunit